ncbi:MFS transporter [Paraburkholderia sp. Ac-20342]|uniref:MFS transporter n=1 Tax=Paraburkholderia sp. Ac-20342 TaxID=2703889 RepID=UPI00198059B8|nr:MFS transporter [Paraburkholderia sp. Ac-20342]MBN3849316.1 MFS transporter [Paraburkholderia sp. Ac-20342]
MQYVDITRLVDEGPFGRTRFLVALLCCFAVFTDGFDTQAIGYIAPALVYEWHISKPVLAPVFASSLIGLMFGSLIFGSFSDRKGRRMALIISVAIFGMFSLLTATVNSVGALLAMRFLTGLGLGGVMPNAVALTSEYAPARIRSTVVMCMFCGFSLGAALGGIAAGALINELGWRSVLIVGGLTPLALVPLLLIYLPESLDFMVAKCVPRVRIEAAIARIAPETAFTPDTNFTRQATDLPVSSVAQLFSYGRAATTLMFWLIFFMSLLQLYLFSSWLPILLHESGLTVSAAATTSSFFQIGGALGTLLLGRFIDRLRPFVMLSVVYLGAAASVVLLGLSVRGGYLALALAILAAGFCIVGGQIAANALAARTYPTSIRATGVGWAFGVGRLGSIVGPLLGGALLALKWDPAQLFTLGCIPALVASIASMVLHSRGAIHDSTPRQETLQSRNI